MRTVVVTDGKTVATLVVMVAVPSLLALVQ